MKPHFDNSEEQLIALLKLAFSAELAAAYAYHGHWQSVTDPKEMSHIRQIKEEELHHRRLVGDMLAEMNSGPSAFKEFRAALLGRVLAAMCHICGWLAPMYGAGRLESRNIREYEAAARYARDSGHEAYVDCLLTMAEVEWEHESYFRARVLSHRWSARLPIWKLPPAKESIRASFASDSL